MRVVVDLGCCHWSEESTSIGPLVERFRPDVLYGFDPYPEVHADEYVLDGTRVVVTPMAAWIKGGEVLMVTDGTRSRVASDLSEPFTQGAVWVQCFDLAEWLLTRPEKVILKMDVEGAEHVLIPHLIETGAIEQVELLLIEWHGEPTSQPALTVPWEVWH